MKTTTVQARWRPNLGLFLGRKMAIFDIDGVLADNSHRLHYALEDKDYEKYYSAEEVLKDKLILPGIDLLQALKDDYNIHFVTARNKICCGATAQWLSENVIAYGYTENAITTVYRDEHDFRPSPIVKVEQMRKLFKFLNVSEDNAEGLFIDDDPENVKAIEKAFPKFKGLVFGTGRLEEENGS